MKIEDAMKSDSEKGLTLETVNAQFCSSWLKDEIKKILTANIEYRIALNTIWSECACDTPEVCYDVAKEVLDRFSNRGAT